MEPGLEADLVAVEGNPLEDPAALQDVLLVVSNGRVALDRLDFAPAVEAGPRRLRPGRCSGAAPAPEYDLSCAAAACVDGSGNPWFVADVGMREGRIAAVGRLQGPPPAASST